MIMIGIGFHFRTLLTAGLVLTLAELPLRTQEQQYRERQVLDPETDEWVDQTRAPDEPPASELDQARAYLTEEEPRKARKLLKQWLKEAPEDDRYYEATYLLGESYFESRDFWKALKQYNTVAENTAGELFHLANQRSVDAARAFLSGEKRIVWRILRLPAYDEGVEILDRVWERVPGTRLGELALKLKADFYFERGDVDLAQDEYAHLVQQYPNGRYIQLAMLRTAESAEAAFSGIRFDDLPLVESGERYRQVLAAFPGYAEHEDVPQRLEGIREQRAEKDLDIARWYERTRQPGAGEFYYRRILADWPDTLAADDARTRLRAMGAQFEGSQTEDFEP